MSPARFSKQWTVYASGQEKEEFLKQNTQIPTPGSLQTAVVTNFTADP